MSHCDPGGQVCHIKPHGERIDASDLSISTWVNMDVGGEIKMWAIAKYPYYLIVELRFLWKWLIDRWFVIVYLYMEKCMFFKLQYIK